MAIRTIDDSKLQNIAVAIQNKDSGGTMTVDEMPTRIEQNLQSKAVLDSVIDGSITSIESDVARINSYKFYSCSQLTEALFPKVKSVYTSVFRGCTHLTYVFVPKLESTTTYLFAECSSLSSVYLPSLIQIGYFTFQNCTSLVKVILEQKAVLQSASNATIPSQTIIYVKPEDLSWYSTATNWSTLYAQDRIKSIEDLTGDDLVWYQEQLARYPIEEAS